MKIAATYLFDNGMVMTFGTDGQQIPELQGKHTPELRQKIIEASDSMTEWIGWKGKPVNFLNDRRDG